ncbi:GNAT family N-acetyltransferase [Sphingobium sp. PNB]|uniref:GNAT family N-acetyltransferase n=1 Tax=Sphingobium sp. PNB TaxID=863934 RepID=UPI001CA43995|nr:GNAT family N-acetyltransferase [Sphingobium sp. PNB]MCB4858438.1 GNAT family N-acetyltransferase [Sphingobium sp. PNB]
MTVSREGAEESARQLIGMWSALVEDYGSAVRRGEPVTHIWANTNFGFYNALTFSDSEVGVTALKERFEHSASFMRDNEHFGFLWIFEELLSDQTREQLDALAVAAGLTRGTTCHGMAGDVLPFPEPSHPQLRFERVRTQEHLDIYASLNARAYDLDVPTAQEALHGSRLWREIIHAYIGYFKDLPVCCAGCYPVEGRLFVVLVAADPAYQRLGFGEAVTRKAIYEAGKATGLTRVTLQATDAGRPVYERIGLQTTSRVGLFSL